MIIYQEDKPRYTDDPRCGKDTTVIEIDKGGRYILYEYDNNLVVEVDDRNRLVIQPALANVIFLFEVDQDGRMIHITKDMA